VQPTSSMAQVSLILGWWRCPSLEAYWPWSSGTLPYKRSTVAVNNSAVAGWRMVGLILGYAALGLEVLSIVLFVVLPGLGCGLCSICGAPGTAL